MEMRKKTIEEFQDDCLSIHNKIQEAITLSRDGKWYLSDTKLQGVKQKVLNLHLELNRLKENENNTN